MNELWQSLQWRRVAVYIALYLLLSYLATAFINSPDQVTLLWPASGLALAFVLRFGLAWCLPMAAAVLLVHIFINPVPLAFLPFSIGSNIIGVLIAVLYIRSRKFDRMLSIKGGFTLIQGALLMCTVSGLIGVAGLYLNGMMGSSFWLALLKWTLGDLLGIICIAPVTLLMISPVSRDPDSPPASGYDGRNSRLLWSFLLLLSLALIFFGGYSTSPYVLSLAMLPIALVVWSAIRLPPVWTTIGNALTVLAVTAMIGLGLGGFILFAAFVPLDEGVPTQGLVSIDTKRKAIQHLQGGIVKEVLVSEGQAVTQNQTLIKLVDEMVRAQYETIRQQFFNLKIIEARLLAEQAGSSVITFDPELTEMALKDKQLNHQFKLQKQLLQARRSSLDSALGALRESSIGQRSIVETSGQIDINRSAQLNSLEKDLVGIRNLVEDGYAPMSKRHELERGVSEIKSSIAENKANQIRAKQAILEIEQRQMSLRADFMKEVEQGLTQIRPDIQSQAEKYKAATQELERTEIKSPVAGQVVGLSVQTVGSVVQAGQRMMEIVPSEEKLVLETKIAPHLIDRVKMGDQVDVRFSSFSDSPQLVVPGVLKTLSSDALTDNTQNAMPYYLARVHVTEEGLKLLGSKKMQPGMPVEIVIKTGSRTLLKYLVSPLTKRIAASMKEQ